MSNSIVVYLRLLTSAEIKTNPDYAAFLFHPETGDQMEPEMFCNNFVEAVGKEAGQSSARRDIPGMHTHTMLQTTSR